jgi:predicted PurR-regulated permease PerM
MPEANGDDLFLSRAVDVSIRIALVALVLVWCFQILRPFIVPVIWGAIIAVAVHPLQQRLADLLGERQRLAAALLTSVGLLLLLVPIGLFAGSMLESAQEISQKFDRESFQIPPPPPEVASWPLVGTPIHDGWSRAATNLGGTLKQFAPQIRVVGGWLLAAGAGTGAAVVQFIISLLIAGVFLASSAGGVTAVGVIAKRVVGVEGERYAQLAGQTIRSVAVGILGVAVIQAVLLSVGFVAVGLPHAGLWSLLVLGLAVLQLPATLVVLPLAIYVFSAESVGVAIAFAVWSFLAGLSDNVLKPILLGRGASVPMLVIFLGSIGGFIWAGFIGLFVGAIVLSLGYELGRAWLDVDGGSSSAVLEAD